MCETNLTQRAQALSQWATVFLEKSPVGSEWTETSMFHSHRAQDPVLCSVSKETLWHPIPLIAASSLHLTAGYLHRAVLILATLFP